MRVVLTQDTGAIVLVLIAIVLFGLYLSWTATRLDRLHVRLDAARVALDAQLVRRAAATSELARSGLLDVATAVILATAAREAQIADEAGEAAGSDEEDGRESAESALTRDLRAAFDDPAQVEQLRATPQGAELVGELGAAMRRVQLARRFHNESVRAVRRLREQWLVRYFRLAGRAPDKPTFEIDDEPPAALAR